MELKMALSNLVEVHKFFVERRKALSSLSEGITKSLEDLSKKGFRLPQGTLIEQFALMAMEARRMTSDANVKVTDTQIDLEIVQAELDYRLQIAQEQIEWDEAKAALLNAFQEEIQVLETAYDLSEEELNEFALEIERRKAALLDAKTAIEIDKEEVKQRLVEIEGMNVGLEVDLINARILTNRKKLEIIPFLEALILKEEELLTVEQSTMGYEQDLIVARGLLIDAKKELLPYITDKANMRMNLADAQIVQVGVNIERAILQLQKSVNEVSRTNAILSVDNKEISLLELQKTLINLKNSIDSKRVYDHKTLITDDMSVDTQVQNIRNALETSLTNTDILISSSRMSGNSSESGIDQAARRNAGLTNISGDISEIQQNSQTVADRKVRTAEISAKAEVTSKLIHLIGGSQ